MQIFDLFDFPQVLKSEVGSLIVFEKWVELSGLYWLLKDFKSIYSDTFQKWWELLLQLLKTQM